ncbi:MAG TPA: diadenylate cyclase CdaA [Dehalococcoidia bacterium]|nr:diadenylate cyclase CdaA [Dehalococcoidia bacterium]
MELVDTVETALNRFNAASVVDIMVITLLIYLGLLLVKGTTAMSLLRGMIIILIAAVILTATFNLTVLSWLLRNSFPAVVIAIPIIFQQEIRRFLERLGRTGRWPWLAGRDYYETVVDGIADASMSLAEKHWGGIVAIERETGLEEYIDTGLKVDAICSSKLLMSIFYPNAALHDGAVIVRGDRVVAASATLPLSERVDSFHGTRHRAALGLTERTDAVCVVISEETGSVSVAANARIISNLDGPRLRGILRSLLIPATEMDRPSGIRLPKLSR